MRKSKPNFAQLFQDEIARLDQEVVTLLDHRSKVVDAYVLVTGDRETYGSGGLPAGRDADFRPADASGNRESTGATGRHAALYAETDTVPEASARGQTALGESGASAPRLLGRSSEAGTRIHRSQGRR